ncbi:hypothetical protein J3Q64DRAFT_1873112 [Phycomyces blakesleeanus]|uniref:PiggyBac transposable element-derived protein domain-containing protein n=1 Tax=Phycomyces blakesleeanus TaxID=4837 RepID=A0ABR3APH6_PHYBL
MGKKQACPHKFLSSDLQLFRVRIPYKKQSFNWKKQFRRMFNFNKFVFSNLIITDGYCIYSLVSRVAQKKKEAPAQKQPADFINDIDKGCQIWAVDPGVCDIITAIDTSGRQRTTSVNEYYHLRGFNDVHMNMEMYMLYEYLTSQVCNEFKKRNVENLVNSKSKRRVHAILQLQETTCNIVWNRDIMAVHNILDIFLFSSRNNNQRPDVSVRQTETNPGHQPSSV